MKTIVLLSGGLDSTVSLFWARERWGDDVSALSVDYKQKHSRELAAGAHSFDGTSASRFADSLPRLDRALRGCHAQEAMVFV